jgi:hypothetical protein
MADERQGPARRAVQRWVKRSLDPATQPWGRFQKATGGAHGSGYMDANSGTGAKSSTCGLGVRVPELPEQERELVRPRIHTRTVSHVPDPGTHIHFCWDVDSTSGPEFTARRLRHKEVRHKPGPPDPPGPPGPPDSVG